MKATILNFRESPWRFAVRLRGIFYFLSAKFAIDSVMSFFDALFTFLFGVALPSWDVYSDVIFGYTLSNPRCNYWDYDEAYQYYQHKHNMFISRKCSGAYHDIIKF